MLIVRSCNNFSLQIYITSIEYPLISKHSKQKQLRIQLLNKYAIIFVHVHAYIMYKVHTYMQHNFCIILYVNTSVQKLNSRNIITSSFTTIVYST